LCALLSVLVVLKRMAFIGQGISHAGFGGVGSAWVLGVTGGLAQDAVVLIFCVLAGVLIGLLSRRGRLEPDSAIGILLVGAMAWGVLMTNAATYLQHFDWYQQWVGPIAEGPKFHAILFGSLMEVGPAQLGLSICVAVVVLGAGAALFKEIVFFSFDESASRVFGVPTTAIYYLLLILLSMVIVIAIRLVGFLLVSALLVIPGAAATLISNRLGAVLTLAGGIGVLGMLGGIGLRLGSGFLSLGPSVVLVLVVLLALAALIRRVTRRPTRASSNANLEQC
jgi:ABC-type Mn2+/Zn2+ transport system permease subunit